MYFIATVVGICLFDRLQVPSLKQSMFAASFSSSMSMLQGLVQSMPTLIFLLMYQPQIPQIYNELKQKSP